MITSTTKRFWVVFLTSIAFFVKNRAIRKWFWILMVIVSIGFLIPQNMVIPVEGATTKNWDDHSFWAYPWGSSVTHKGIDIFADMGTYVLSSTKGIVIYTHEGGKGGKSVMVLGPKWRFHYYAHLSRIDTFPMDIVSAGSIIGAVGDTGNANGKPPHLHYAITTPFPYVSLKDDKAIQGWKKMFYLDPDTWLRN